MTNTQTKCEDCNNRGWVRSYSYDSVNHPDGYYIQHCGSCTRFKSDQEVRDYLKENHPEVLDASAEQIRDWFFENRCDIYDESRYDESVELAAIHFGLPQSRILAILQDDELL